MSYRKKFGSYGEEIAAKMLLKKGYSIVAKNFRSRYGEIDIIAKDGNTLIFVEVKTRVNKKYGKPEEAVTSMKLDRIKKTMDYYFLVNKSAPLNVRIEVVALEIIDNKLISAKLIKVV